jgi:hypothetical protein
MAAIVTDQFRILNANNFVETVENSTNSYYVFLGLDNPTAVGFGRTTAWDTNTPNPVDNFNYMDWCGDTMMFGKKVTSANIRRLVRRINWTQGTRYEMYRSDYSITNLSPITRSARLYDANYYVMNKNYDVYICIENGSTGISTTGNASQDEPLFTDLEPSRAGESGDGYVWKYLFTVPPSDIIKFDSTEYISVPNDWSTSTETQIQAVRENGNSDLNNNQIKTVYVDRTGTGYSQNVVGKEVDIVGDGTGAKVVLDTNSSGQITKTTISAGGKNYTYGMVDLGPIGNSAVSVGNFAKLIPVIPPSKGHGYDLYKELGTDKILIYARFDDSTRDFPTDTKFAQIGIVKNPTTIGSGTTFTDNQYSSVNAVKLSTTSGTPVIGEKIQQTVSGGTAEGYVVSFNTDTKVLKYFNDRSLYFNPTTLDQTDYVGVSTEGKVLPFESSGNNIVAPASGFSGSVDTNFTGISTNPTGNKLISLGVQFTNGLANSEINRGSGEIIYLDNRPLITRNARQKEDVKIILEF